MPFQRDVLFLPLDNLQLRFVEFGCLSGTDKGICNQKNLLHVSTCSHVPSYVPSYVSTCFQGRGIFGKPQQHRSVVLQLPSRLAELSSSLGLRCFTVELKGRWEGIRMHQGCLVKHFKAIFLCLRNNSKSW